MPEETGWTPAEETGWDDGAAAMPEEPPGDWRVDDQMHAEETPGAAEWFREDDAADTAEPAPAPPRIDPARVTAGLDPDQLKAVTDRERALLILAGPGSGKTRVLCHRFLSFVAEGTPVERILGITFTRKATREMGARLEAELGTRPGWILTFHGLCVRILRTDGGELGLGRWQIADTDRARRCAQQAVEALNLSVEEYVPRAMHARISLHKNHGEDFHAVRAGAQHPRAHAFADIYQRYQRILQDERLLDFDDLLVRTVDLLGSRPDCRTRWRERWDHLLVDECQDSNGPQYEIVKLVARDDRVTIVGDPDQSIYGWRGARVANMERFRREFDPAIVGLGSNYRSTRAIVECAKAVVEKLSPSEEIRNARRIRKLESRGAAGTRVRLIDHEDERAEALWIRRRCGLEKSSVGIIYRVNALSRPIEDELIRHSIPYTITGGARFYDRTEVRNAVAYLRILADPGDDDALGRILNVPARGLGARALETIRGITAGTDSMEAPGRLFGRTPTASVETPARSLWGKLQTAVREGELPGRQTRGAEQLLDLLGALRLRVIGGDDAPASLLQAVLERTGYRRKLAESKHPEDHERAENLEQLVATATEYEDKAGGAAHLQDFLDEIALMTDVEHGRDGDKRVHLMTMHAAKGLEFDTVLVAGCEDGLCPMRPREDEPRTHRDALAEERRLFYVAMTRARTALCLNTARQRTRFGRRRATEPSPYLQELPEELIELRTTRRR